MPTRTTPPPQRVEVHLEELGQHSWLLALANTLAGTSGSAQYRFVARAAGVPDRPSSHVLVGATFPLMRWQDLDDERLPNGFADLARERLAEIDEQLRAKNWQRCDGVGRHWWSLAYEAGEPPPGGTGRPAGECAHRSAGTTGSWSPSPRRSRPWTSWTPTWTTPRWSSS